MKYLMAALLQAIAFGVGFAEVVIPSFGMLSVLCAGIAVYSWYYILTELPRSAAVIFGIADLLLIPIAVKLSFAYLARSPMSHRTDLGTGSGLEGRDLELSRHVGALAQVEAQLRPTGKIRIGDDLFEAQTTGEWVEKGQSVRVVSVNGSRFQVEKA